MSFIPTNISDPALAPLIEIQENIRQALAALDERVNGGPLFGHHATHEPGGNDPMAVNAAAAVGSLRTLGTTALSAAAGTDGRLSDARTPVLHASTHNAGGSDVLVIDAVAAVGSLRTLGAGAQQAMPGNASPAGRLRSFQILTSGTSYTRPAGIVSILVEGWAGGGGGCGVAAAGAGAISMGPGGGSGGYFRKWYVVAPATGTYAIGAAGTAGNNAGAAAGNGGNTTFTDGTTLCTANGGTGGPGFTASGTTALYGIGGAGGAISTNGDLNLAGEAGGTCERVVNTGLANQGIGGAGGDSPFGSGGGSSRVTTGAGNNAATNSGAGGGGALALSSGAANVGGTGGAGRIIVWEYS